MTDKQKDGDSLAEEGSGAERSTRLIKPEKRLTKLPLSKSVLYLPAFARIFNVSPVVIVRSLIAIFILGWLSSGVSIDTLALDVPGHGRTSEG